MSRLIGAGRHGRIHRSGAERAANEDLSVLKKTRLIRTNVRPEWLTTYAPNTLPMTGFLGANLFEVSRNNSAALVLGATAVRHTADLVVSAGHKHDTALARLVWKQIAVIQFHCEGDNAAAGSGLSPVGTPPDECIDAILLSSAVTQDLAYFRFWAQPVDSARIIPRIRVSNDNSATTNCTITLSFFDRNMTLIATRALAFSTATLRNRVWLEMNAIDLSTVGVVDPDQAARQHFIVRVRGVLAADTEDVALHELQLGVLQS